jgi:glucose/galactose transporter
MASNQSKSNLVSLLLIGLLFSIFGFITWLNGTLIKFLQTACQLNNTQASLVTFAFFISYFVMALPSSAILRKTGFKNGMGLGLVVMAVGCLLFIPAAFQRNYMIFLVGLFTQGLGLAILQTAANPYVTIIGPIESAAKRISLMGICNKLAGALGSIVLGKILLDPLGQLNKDIEAAAFDKEQLLNNLAHRIVTPYTVLTIVLVLVAIFIRFSPLPDVHDDDDETASAKETARPLGSYTYMWLGALAIFTYVGVEVLAGDYIINFGTYLGVPIEFAKYLTSLTLFFMLGGYLLGVALIPKIISQEVALKLNVIGGLIFALGAVFLQGKAAVFCLAFLGFFHAVMWPAIWPMAIKGLGKWTKTGSALLIMGIAGGAVIPFLYSRWADAMGGNLQRAFLIMIPCYLYILFFALKGHKIGYKAPAAKDETTQWDMDATQP